MAHCSEHSRAAFVRRGLAEAGRGLPAIEPGMPMPAGTGLDRRTFVARGVGLALAVYGGSALRPELFDEGIAAAAAAAPQRNVLVSVFLDGGADALSLLAPTGDPLYRQLRPRLALPDGRAGVRRGRHAELASVARAAGRAARRGEGERDARHRLRPPQPVALHLPALLGGRSRGRAARRRAGSAATSTASARMDNPLQGLSLDWSLQPSLATAKMPVAAVDAPDSYDFWARGVWGEVSERMVATIGRLGAIPTRHDPGPRGGGRRSAPVRPALRAAHAVPPEGRQEAAARPGGLPGERRRLPAPARRPRGDARRRNAAARRRAVGSRRLRHARQPGGRSRRRPEADRRLAPRLPARPRGARARRPRARARLVGVRPAGRRRTAPAAPTTAPRAPAS